MPTTTGTNGNQQGSSKDPIHGKRTTPGVEAIFLTTDPEEGDGTSKGQELWRQQTKGASAGHTRNKSAGREGRSGIVGKMSGTADQHHPGATSAAATPSSIKQQRTPVASPRIYKKLVDDPKSPPVSWRNPLRKTQSFSDAIHEEDDAAGSRASSATTIARRRMSISVTQYSTTSRTDDAFSSRRSSAASIIISLSRPESPQSQHILKDAEEERRSPEPPPQTVEFMRIRTTATTVTVATKFKPHDSLHPERAANGGTRKQRRNSAPTIPKLNLQETQQKGDSGAQGISKEENTPIKRPPSADQVSRRHRRRSSSASIQHGFYMPASRPSSAMAMAEGIFQDQSRRSSSVTIGALGKVSRPWTPVRSPSVGSNASPRVGTIGGTTSRNQLMLFRGRMPGSMAAPLQALNQKVNNILGCAANILDFYNMRPDASKRSTDPRRSERLLKSMAMNQFQMPGPGESADERLAKFRRTHAREVKLRTIGSNKSSSSHRHHRQLGRSRKLTKLKTSTKAPKIVMNNSKNLDVSPQRKLLSASGSATQHDKDPSMQNSSTASVSGSATPEPGGLTKIKSKGFALLKSLMANKNSVAVAEAFTGKTLPLKSKVKITKAIKRNKQVFKMRQSKIQSNNAASTNQGPPTLVNFFKRGMQTRGSKKETENRAPIKYETFTDKDRAAAVLLGESDIKNVMEKQLKSERGRYVLPKESPAQVYLAQADFEMRIGGLATARGLLDKALELQPGDKNALCSRSRCRLMMGDARGALDDAEEALANDSLCVKATYQKAEVLYQMGRFEEALVFYHTGSKQRPDMELFHQGVRKAQEAIEVSLGVKLPTMQQQQQQRTTVIQKKKKPGELPANMTVTKLPPLNLNPHCGRSFKGAASRKETSLLGDLHVDKIYLEKLLQNPGLRHQSGSTQKIINHAKDTLEYLKSRENFWRQQQPSAISYPIIKENRGIKIGKKKRKSAAYPLSQRTSNTSTSGTNRDAPMSSSRSGGSSSNNEDRTDDASPDSLTEQAISSSHDASRSSSEDGDAASSRAGSYVDEGVNVHQQQLPDNDIQYLEGMRTIIEEMTQHSEQKQLNRSVQTYLTKCWRGPADREDFTEEIETKMSQLELHEMEKNDDRAQEYDADMVQRTTIEKTKLTIEIAMLYLANGQEDLAKMTTQQCLQLARETNDIVGLIQVYLLKACLSALAGDPRELEDNLAYARKTLHKGMRKKKRNSQLVALDVMGLPA